MIWREIGQRALMISNLAPRGQANDPRLNTDVMVSLRLMLSKWSRDGLLQPAFDSMSRALIGGQNTYTCGPSGDFTKRPVELFQCILSNASLGQTREPIPIYGWDAFEDLTFPSAQGIPSCAYYNPTYPLGLIGFDITPNANWTAKFIGQFAWDEVEPTDEVSLPPGYADAITDSLAVKIAQDYNRPVTQDLKNRARDGESSIRIALPVKDRAKNNKWAYGMGRPVRNWQTDSPR